jgi:hypothetical protein
MLHLMSNIYQCSRDSGLITVSIVFTVTELVSSNNELVASHVLYKYQTMYTEMR